MPTGLNDSPDVVAAAAPAGRPAPQPEINVSFPMKFPASGVINLPGFLVPSRATVRIRSRSGNTHVVHTSLNRDYLTDDFADVISPDTEIIYPVANLAEIWAKGTEGETIIVSVRANGIG